MYEAATKPTMYFIGVTTTQSSIMKVFPVWMRQLGIDAEIKGIDLPIHAAPEIYREAVTFIKKDPLSLGALVTTHKIDIFTACEELFDDFDPYARLLGEISSISKNGEKLVGHAKDPISSGLALEAFVPPQYWQQHGGEVLLLGAGGASLAMATYFTMDAHAGNMPRKIILANRSTPRLEDARQKLADILDKTEFAFVHGATPRDNDRLMEALPEHSLIVNATGLGKDAPGSPITDEGRFPMSSLVWEINYRGELDFMHQAERQRTARNLTIEDGWIYFIHGWTQVIMEVFHTGIDAETLNRLSDAAKAFQQIKK